MADRDVKQDFQFAKDKATDHKQNVRNAQIDDKKTKAGMNAVLKDQWQKQEVEAESTKQDVLKLEKNILGNASQFDGYVDDIILAKREYLEKLRSQRPF